MTRDGLLFKKRPIMIEGCNEGFSIRMSRWGMFEFVQVLEYILYD